MCTKGIPGHSWAVSPFCGTSNTIALLLANKTIANMQEEDDLRGLARVMDFMRGISFLFIATHIYWYCHE
jgi:hypothetical protein